MTPKPFALALADLPTPLVSALLPPFRSFPSGPRARDHRRDRGIPSPLLHTEITALLPLIHPVTPLGTHLPSERDPEPNTAALAKPRRAGTLRCHASAAALPPEPPQALQEFRRASRSPSAHSFPGSEPCNAWNSFSAAPPDFNESISGVQQLGEPLQRPPPRALRRPCRQKEPPPLDVARCRRSRKFPVRALHVPRSARAVAALPGDLGEIPMPRAFRFAASGRFPWSVDRSRVVA